MRIIIWYRLAFLCSVVFKCMTRTWVLCSIASKSYVACLMNASCNAYTLCVHFIFAEAKVGGKSAATKLLPTHPFCNDKYLQLQTSLTHPCSDKYLHPPPPPILAVTNTCSCNPPPPLHSCTDKYLQPQNFSHTYILAVTNICSCRSVYLRLWRNRSLAFAPANCYKGITCRWDLNNRPRSAG